MKRIIKFAVIVFIVIIITDILVGFGCRFYINNHRLSGEFGEIDYIVNKSDEDIIILGSSVALNGINPNIITDSLRASCYNGGANGQILPYYESLLECIVKRENKPSIIILGLRTNELAGEGNGGRYSVFLPYYHTGMENIDKRLEAKSREEKYFLSSNLYRYNPIWWRLFLYVFLPPEEKGKNGFTGNPLPMVYPELKNEISSPITNERINSFLNMVQLCKKNDIKLIILFPPMYFHYSDKTETIDYIEKYCIKNGIPCYNDSQDSTFTSDNHLFYDNIHVNIEGCKKYTLIICKRLKQLDKNNFLISSNNTKDI